jgi:RHS repeat-associated protein
MDSGTVPSGTAAGPAGAGGYDMGARRFGPDIGSFLQQDQFEGALDDLGLTLDPLSQNRYALAGGNPVSYVEWDGHAPPKDNPVSANPQLNVQLNSPDSTWSAKDRFVGCACAGLDQQVQAANQAQQRRSPAGAVGKFVGGVRDYFAGFVGGYVEAADIGVPGPNDVVGFGGTVIRGRYVYPQNVPSYTDVYEQRVSRWGVNTASASYTAGEIVGFPAVGGLTAAGVKTGARVGAKAAARRLATHAAAREAAQKTFLPHRGSLVPSCRTSSMIFTRGRRTRDALVLEPRPMQFGTSSEPANRSTVDHTSKRPRTTSADSRTG